MLPARIRSALLALSLVALSCSPGGPEGSPPRQTSSSPPPVPSSSEAIATVRFAAVGDIGDGSARQASVAAAIARVHQQRPLDSICSSAI